MSRFFKNTTQVVTVLGLIAVFCVLMIMGLYARDYDLKVEDGKLQFVSEIGIATPMVLSLNNTDPGKITAQTKKLPSVDGYQFRVSGNPAFFLAKTYRSQIGGHTEANLKKGKTYYFQVRAYKENEAGRVVFGKWGAKRSIAAK